MTGRFLSFLIISISINFSCGDPLVKLPKGTIRGRESQTLTGNLFYSFQKIPYATPPIYNLRFKAPVPAINWNGILDASNELDVICLQTLQNYTIASEDCLYLNVFTPRIPNDDDVTALPVMLFIHGGAFLIGTSIPQYGVGPEYLIDDGVVVVTINYRLGPLGFLSTGDDVIPGNNGLKDQLLAIQWTHDNIKFFGGDPDKITIFGQSAGSRSVAFQLLHTKSQGLFVGAISESGSTLTPASLSRNPRERAFALASLLNETFNNTDDSEALLQFLQSVSSEEINLAAQRYAQTETLENRQIYQGFFWGPVIETDHEGAFITQKMYSQVKSGDIVKVPCLIGMNSEEELVEWSDSDALKSALQGYDENLEFLVPDDMMIEDDADKVAMGTKIRDIYTEGSPLADNLGAGVRLFTDNSYSRGIIKQAELQSNFTDVYFYLFSYDGELGGSSIHYDGAGNVSHGEELSYIWRNDRNSDLSVFPESDQITQRRIQKIWSDFAKFQNPTPETSDLLQNITWPKVSADDFLYVDIGENLEIKSHPKSEIYTKWTELYDSLDFDDFDTY